MFGLKLRDDLTHTARQRIAHEHLELVGLGKFTHSNVHELSGGMKQRVALARALAPDPRVLLMDEPLASLDALTREQLYGDIQRIWASRHKTIILVTHNVREAVCLGDRVILLTGCGNGTRASADLAPIFRQFDLQRRSIRCTPCRRNQVRLSRGRKSLASGCTPSPFCPLSRLAGTARLRGGGRYNRNQNPDEHCKFDHPE